MSHPGRATNEAANNEWREVLATIKEEIQALVANKKDGVTADECSSVRTLGWTLADPLRGLTKTPISPGYSGPLAEARCEDELTKRLLCGAQVWDGGNRGVPLQGRKVGACFCDALALGVFGGGLEAADDAWQYSLPIRVAIVRTALRHMPQFLNLEYYTTLQAYDAAVLDEVTTIGCPVTPVLPPMVARVFYLLGVAEMASEFATCQQAAVPWASEALRVKIRPFHPGNSVEVGDGWACVGGQWSKQEFPPLSMTNMDPDALDALPTLHLSMTLSSWEGKPFSNIKEFGIVCREEDTQRLNMPEFGHWVFLLAPENFGALRKEEVQALAEVRALEVEEERLRAVDVLAGRHAQGCAVDETCAHPVESSGLESAKLAAETEVLRREQTSADVVVEEPMAERLVQTTQTSQERQVLSATASMVLLLLSPSTVPVLCLVACLVVILLVLALKGVGALLVAEAAADVRSGSADDAHGCTRGVREWRNDPQGKKRPRKGWRKRQVRARRRLARRRRRWRRQKKQGRAKMRRFPKPVVQRRRRATTRRATHATVMTEAAQGRGGGKQSTAARSSKRRRRQRRRKSKEAPAAGYEARSRTSAIGRSPVVGTQERRWWASWPFPAVGRRLGDIACYVGTQLGVGFSSNNAGDGPPSRCCHCEGALEDMHRMCKACYDDGRAYPEDSCSVCGVLFNASEKTAKRRTLRSGEGTYVGTFNRFLATGTDETRFVRFRERVALMRNLEECPVRPSDSLCTGECFLTLFEAVMKRTKGLKSMYRGHRENSHESKGRPVVHTTPVSGGCPVCTAPMNATSKARWAGGHCDAWELFFWKERQPKRKAVDKVSKMEMATAICQSCYMRWYNATRRARQEGTQTSASITKESYIDAADAEADRAKKLQDSIDQGGAQHVRKFALEKVRVLFREEILREVLGGYKPCTLSDLRGALAALIEDAPGCEGVLKGTASDGKRDKTDAQKLDRWVEDDLDVVYASVPFWTRSIGWTRGDQRTRGVVVLPVAHDAPQVVDIVQNMLAKVDGVQKDLDYANQRIQALEQEIAEAKAKAPTREEGIVQRAAEIIRRALAPYGRENDAFVFRQATGSVGLDCPTPTEEFNKNAPPVLATFVTTLAGNQDADPDDGEALLAHVSRKCVIAGVLTSFATNTWWKYANVAGLFLKERGIGRRGLDWLAKLLKITRTDNAMWRLQKALSKHHGSVVVKASLVPMDASWVGISWDNVNIECRVDFGQNGRIDVIATISYFHADRAAAPVIDTSPGPPKSFELVRDFCMTDARVSGVMREWEIDVANCALDDTRTPSENKTEGDFELRLAKRHIAKTKAAIPGKTVGVEGRRIPGDITMNYLGIELLGTKTVGETMQYLDRISRRLHVGVEGGRTRAVVAGDQETFNNMHKAKAKFPEKYGWVLPWVGDWHFLEHTLDAIFRKWGGFGLYKLARASGCYDKKLEGKSYHKRHFLLVSILEAVWKACASEVARGADGGGEEARETEEHGSTGGDAGPQAAGERLLNTLRLYLADEKKHKTFGCWVDLLLRDGMAYLALYVGIRVGDFELRESAIRTIAPLFLGYNKNLYHDLCITHLADIARLSDNERAFVIAIFSLSLKGNIGKNMGMDEIQETTFNLNLKVNANRVDFDYLSRLSAILQVKTDAASTFEQMFDSGLSRERAVRANARRTRVVEIMSSELVREGSPFRLTDQNGRTKVVAQDGRVALPHLEEAILRARSTSNHLWTTGVALRFPELGHGPNHGVGMRKRGGFETFSDGIKRKKPKPRAQSVVEKRVDDLEKIVAAQSRDIAAQSKGQQAAAGPASSGGQPLLVSGMPPQMGFYSGHLHGISKSKAKGIVEEHASGAMRVVVPKDSAVPHTCAIDMATVVHQVSPRQVVEGTSVRNWKTWGAYARHITEILLYRTCSREGTLDGDVILCLDKRQRVSNVKAFAHAVRFNMGTTAAAGKGKKRKHKYKNKRGRSKKQGTAMWITPKAGFALDDPTPQEDAWVEFLSDRQNRDNVFAIICKFLRMELKSIEDLGGQNLTAFHLHLSQIKLRVDGEPVVSEDFTETLGYVSWHTDNCTSTAIYPVVEDDGLGPTVEVQHAWANFSRPQQEASPAARITKDKENGFGEGEVQALHHAWMLSQLTGGATKGARLFEIMSIDTDVWVAALLVYCVFPSTQNVRVVVRSQRGVGSTRECQQIDVLQLFDEITHLPHWPAEFTPLQRCLPVIAAYVLCGTDFTPTLHGITSASMFGAYYQFAKNAGNFGFVRPLGDAEKDGESFVGLNVREEECVKFVGLCYFEKNKKLFESPDPGKQVKGGVEPDPTKEWIDHIAWRTYVKHFGRAHWQKVVPDFDVLELHVLRLRWVISYWLSSRCITPAIQYPVPVPEYDGLGYCKDGDGDAEAALMVMRRQPWVTLKPGEGIHEVFCKCAVKDGRAKCLNCVCKPYGKCSQLCNCRGICGNNGEGSTGGGGASPRSGGADDDNGDNELSDESNTDTSDSESETDEPLDAGVLQGGFSLGFDEDNAREYAEDLAREEAGQGQEGGVWRV